MSHQPAPQPTAVSARGEHDDPAGRATIPDMASRTCWMCGTLAHQTMLFDPMRDASAQVFYCAYRCDECGAFSTASMTYGGTIAEAKKFMTDDNELTWFPTRIAGKDFPDVPEHIASTADEAHKSFSIGALRAAILLARAVVEATAKHNGILKGTLADKIDELEAKGLVRPMIKDTAHEIRYLGNNMAHGDFVDPVTTEETEDVLFFMDEVLNEVYQSPARLNARKSARLAGSRL